MSTVSRFTFVVVLAVSLSVGFSAASLAVETCFGECRDIWRECKDDCFEEFGIGRPLELHECLLDCDADFDWCLGEC